MSATSWVRTPLDPVVSRWNTVTAARTVLVVIHNVASANRMADILPVFESDPRVQLVFCTPGSSVISEGTIDELARTDGTVIPWDQALAHRFDLAISVNHSGDLHRIRAPLFVLPHGIGYTKYSPGTGNRKIYGLDREWLIRDGRVFADALGLSHRHQFDALAAAVPEARPAAVLTGDPCLDRMRVSRRRRPRYRAALGVSADTRLVTLSSTWGPDSLLGSRPDLPRRLLAELPLDKHRVALVLHPNVWYAHGVYQIRQWLADCLRAGLLLIDPRAGWQQAILAADVVVGDHGAVTGYAAAVGRPTMLAVYPDHEVVAGTAIAALGRLAPRLDATRPLTEQLHDRLTGHRPERLAEVGELATSAPDQAAARIRGVSYRLLGLAEPAADPPVHPLPVADLPTAPPVPAAVVTGVWRPVSATMAVCRRPADALAGLSPWTAGADGHLCVHIDHPLRRLRENAGVLYCHRGELPSTAGRWQAETLREWPCCTCAAVVESDRACLVRTRWGADIRLCADAAGGPPAGVLASIPHLWHRAGASGGLPERLHVDVGTGPLPVRIRRC